MKIGIVNLLRIKNFGTALIVISKSPDNNENEYKSSKYEYMYTG